MLLALVVLLVAMNVWVHVGPARAHLVTGPVAALGLLLLARADGLTWAQLGLARQDLVRGALYGAVAAAVVAVVYAAAVAIPSTRGAFRDSRYQVGPGAAVFLSLVTIPLATVVFEEVAFRGVLWAELASELDAYRATAVSALLFGLWHVLPALDLTRTRSAIGAGGRARQRTRVLLTVLGTVAFTMVAGVVLAELRRRSGSLIAPAVLHWATNGLGVLAAARVWALTPRPQGQPPPTEAAGGTGANSCSR